MSDPAGAAPAAPRLTVCVPTYKRPEGIERVVRSLAGGTRTPDRVVVVDNDPAASAGPVLARLRPELPFELIDVVEPEPGVSAARNRAVAEALAAGTDLVAFVDDDEVVQPGWADALVDVHRRTGAPVVTGGVDFDFDGHRPPAWLAPLYSLPEHPDGGPIHYAVTGNVLLTAELLGSLGTVFDPRYGRTGGEDSHLFERLRLAGIPMVYAAGARVTEMVSPDRVGLGWVLRREHWRGTIQSVVLRDVRPSGRAYAKRVGAGLLHVASGAAGALMVWRGRAGVVTGVHRAAYGLGLLAGLRARRRPRYG